MLNDVEFREVQEVAKVDKVKIVACDGKSKYNIPFYASKQIKCNLTLHFICLLLTHPSFARVVEHIMPTYFVCHKVVSAYNRVHEMKY